MASALSSIINQPHTAQRFKLHSPSCLTFFKHKHFSFFPPPKPFSISSPRPLHLFAASLNFSSLSNKSQNPSLRDFIAPASLTASQLQPRVPDTEVPSTGRIYHETYGCQMNVNDMEIVLSIMKNAGYTEIATVPENAEIIFINTCAIRENAELKVWQRLNYFWFLKRNWKTNVATGRSQSLHPPKVVVLGCMAERLKEKILDADKMVDVVCGPDAYRDLPRLLEEVECGQKGINTLLSLEETYADINPVRISKNSISAFVSVMRGCNNMCSFCIVPFTRGRERSRPVDSIVREVAELWKEGVKEVTLLGQNVNSYNDASVVEKEAELGSNWKLSEGFSSISKVRTTGLRFSDLLDRLSSEFPEMRFRFTSPHPKDFPDELLYLMRERHNICKLIHLPAQTGSSTMLQRMRRGYTREAYLSLVQKIRSIIPDVALSSDFISGFCGETEEDHSDTLSLVKEVGYDMAYMFAYSMREKTHAHRNYVDDVPEETKQRRLTEVIETFLESTGKCYDGQVGTTQLVLVEGPNKRAPDTELMGKSDKGHRVLFANLPISDREDVNTKRNPVVGDYVEVRITRSTRASLFGDAIAITKLSSFYNNLDREAIACSM
ncbi:CDK5RAP1-like protein isoform X2 [Cicer arietinum]|uniref:CDK5RAP1-like protein isoform X2 n=1 Tax=Cicer arietinum TaxID=3827 RepID=A0A1S2YYW9_CICAR|nr:CDK5RAP1-like protein isoform X2 [Cicer arietinum]